MLTVETNLRKVDMYDLLKMMEGDIIAIGSGAIDPQIEENLVHWCELHYRMLDRFYESAKGESGRYQASVKQISDHARKHLKNVYEEIGEYLEEWDKEDKDA